jgi:hypothetical protein
MDVGAEEATAAVPWGRPEVTGWYGIFIYIFEPEFI